MGWFTGLLVTAICWFDVHLSYKLCCRVFGGGWFCLCLVVVPRCWVWVWCGVLGCLAIVALFAVWVATGVLFGVFGCFVVS